MNWMGLPGFSGQNSSFHRRTLAAGLAALALNVGLPSVSHAVIAFTGSYTQDFNTLALTGTGVPWANDSTLPGWSLFGSAGGAISAYTTGTGSVGTGSFYSFGSAGSTDRALGGVASGGVYFNSPSAGAVAGYFAVALQNGTGSTLSRFAVSFDGEQWRNGGSTSVHTMVMEYGFGSTFATVPSWTAPGAGFNFSSPVASTPAGAVDGNGPGLLAGLGGSISTPWGGGETLWIRWIERNDTGDDHGLAIDNFSITAAPVPEPATYLGGLLLALPLGAEAFRRLRRRQSA